RPTQQETFYPVRCANTECGRVRWLSRSAALKAEQEQRVCRHCQTSQAGKLGYAATAARHGVDFALRAVRQRQVDHPTYHEQIIAAWQRILPEDGFLYHTTLVTAAWKGDTLAAVLADDPQYIEALVKVIHCEVTNSISYLMTCF